MYLNEWIKNEFDNSELTDLIQIDRYELSKKKILLRHQWQKELESTENPNEDQRRFLRRYGVVMSICQYRDCIKRVDKIVESSTYKFPWRPDPAEEATKYQEDLERQLNNEGLTQEEINMIQEATGIPITDGSWNDGFDC